MKQTPLKNFKSYLVVGNRCAFSASWCKLAILTVTRVHPKRVAFSHPTRIDRDSWLGFPRLSEISETAPGNFSIMDPYGRTLVYDFSAEGIANAEKNLA